MNTEKSEREQMEQMSTMVQSDIPAEDGAMRIGATRIGYAYIFEKKGDVIPSDLDLVFSYDAAGNQTRREVISTT